MSEALYFRCDRRDRAYTQRQCAAERAEAQTAERGDGGSCGIGRCVACPIADDVACGEIVMMSREKADPEFAFSEPEAAPAVVEPEPPPNARGKGPLWTAIEVLLSDGAIWSNRAIAIRLSADGGKVGMTLFRMGREGAVEKQGYGLWRLSDLAARPPLKPPPAAATPAEPVSLPPTPVQVPLADEEPAGQIVKQMHRGDNSVAVALPPAFPEWRDDWPAETQVAWLEVYGLMMQGAC